MENILERFQGDVSQHQMTIEIDSGVNRVLLFRKPDCSSYHFRITTWAGYLCISGDMGTYVFSRNTDMFQFFRNENLAINPDYWGEKLQSEGRHRKGHIEWDSSAARQYVIDHILTPIREEGTLEEYQEARSTLDLDGLLDENPDEWEFMVAARNCDLIEYDFWDGFNGSVEKLTFHYQWCCYAIVWAIQQYDKHTATQAVF